MVYKLNPQLGLIKTPVIHVVEGVESQYSNGEELIPLTFDKNYIIDSISARDGSVVVTLKENKHITWDGEEAVSFT